MKTIAETDETIVGVPVIVEPIEVQVPLVIVPVQVRDVAVAVRVLPERTGYHLCHHPLNALGVESYLGSKILQYPVPSIFIFWRLKTTPV